MSWSDSIKKTIPLIRRNKGFLKAEPSQRQPVRNKKEIQKYE